MNINDTNKTKENFDLTTALRSWRKERNITSVTRETYVKQIIEELFELYDLPKKQIDIDTKTVYDMWFKDYEDTEVQDEVIIDGAKDIGVFSENFIEANGYNSHKVSEEVFKEISCRKQDPKQKKEWKSSGVKGKWQKDLKQPKEELYEADFSNCRLIES